MATDRVKRPRPSKKEPLQRVVVYVAPSTQRALKSKLAAEGSDVTKWYRAKAAEELASES